MATSDQYETSDEYASALPPTSHAKLRTLCDYWRSIHPPAGGLPGRRHFDPTAVPALLPLIWLVDVHRHPLRFKHRLVGSEQVRIMERNVTGMWLDEAHPLFLASRAYPQFVAVAERGEIGYRRGRPLFHLRRQYLSMERLLLPLAHDGKLVDMLLAITVYHRDV